MQGLLLHGLPQHVIIVSTVQTQLKCNNDIVALNIFIQNNEMKWNPE